MTDDGISYNTGTTLRQCPHCGGAGGFVIRYMARCRTWYEFDGYAEHTEQRITRGGGVAYCTDCDKRIGRVFFGRPDAPTAKPDGNAPLFLLD